MSARKSTEQKMLEGNAGKRNLVGNDPRPDLVIPAMPNDLADQAQVLWKELAPKLIETGQLTSIDGVMFAALCEVWAINRDASRRMQAEGSVIDGKPSAAYRIFSDTAKQLRPLCAQFGLSPSARVGLAVQVQQAKGEKDFVW